MLVDVSNRERKILPEEIFKNKFRKERLKGSLSSLIIFETTMKLR